MAWQQIRCYCSSKAQQSCDREATHMREHRQEGRTMGGAFALLALSCLVRRVPIAVSAGPFLAANAPLLEVVPPAVPYTWGQRPSSQPRLEGTLLLPRMILQLAAASGKPPAGATLSFTVTFPGLPFTEWAKQAAAVTAAFADAAQKNGQWDGAAPRPRRRRCRHRMRPEGDCINASISSLSRVLLQARAHRRLKPRQLSRVLARALQSC